MIVSDTSPRERGDQHYCSLNDDSPVIGWAPRAQGGRQQVYGCRECDRRWIRTEYGYSILSHAEQLLKGEAP